MLFLPAATKAELSYTNSYGIWGFITNTQTITITSHTGTNTQVIIPDSIDGLPVTSIGEGAFFSESGATLTRIIIPNSVTNIGYMGFYECTSLIDVTMGNGLIDIGGAAFSGCTNLTSVTIPESLVTIGNGAFNSCLSLTNVTIGPNVTMIGDSAFDVCVSLQNISIPRGVTNISFYAFNFCTNLTNITVDPLNSAYSSVDGVLFDKTQKRLVLWPEGRTGGYAVPNSVASIDNGAFFQCTGLSQITIPDSVGNIGIEAFYFCTNLGSAVLGNGVTNIGGLAFGTCLSLTNLTLGNGVVVIGPAAFQLCPGLSNLTIGNSVKIINMAAFLSCSGLTSLTIGEGVTNISNDAFGGCSRLTNVVVGSSVASIGSYAFENCGNLTGIQFQGNAPSLPGGTNAFQGDDLTIFYLPGTAGWGQTFAGFATAPWVLPYPIILTCSTAFGPQTNRFGFTVSWATNASVIVEAAVDLKTSNWSPVQTNALNNGVMNFTDPEWTKHPIRFYRVRSL